MAGSPIVAEPREQVMYTKVIILAASIAITGAGLVVLAPSASARDRPVVVTARDLEAPTRRVSYADLNLASRPGERTLNRRVDRAVTDVCAESGDGSHHFEDINCRNFAWDGARPQIARAVQRARELASTGQSSIAAAAIVLSFPQ